VPLAADVIRGGIVPAEDVVALVARQPSVTTEGGWVKNGTTKNQQWACNPSAAAFNI